MAIINNKHSNDSAGLLGKLKIGNSIYETKDIVAREAIDVLTSDNTTTGSILKSIKDEAKNADFTFTGAQSSTTIGAAIQAVQDALDASRSGAFKVVDQLPDASDAETNVIYLVPKSATVEHGGTLFDKRLLSIGNKVYDTEYPGEEFTGHIPSGATETIEPNAWTLGPSDLWHFNGNDCYMRGTNANYYKVLSMKYSTADSRWNYTLDTQSIPTLADEYVVIPDPIGKHYYKAASGTGYIEWVYVKTGSDPDVYQFEEIGDTDIDLTNYYTKAEVDTAIASNNSTIVSQLNALETVLTNALNTEIAERTLAIASLDSAISTQLGDWSESSIFEGNTIKEAIESVYSAIAGQSTDTFVTSVALDNTWSGGSVSTLEMDSTDTELAVFTAGTAATIGGLTIDTALAVIPSAE